MQSSKVVTFVSYELAMLQDEDPKTKPIRKDIKIKVNAFIKIL